MLERISSSAQSLRLQSRLRLRIRNSFLAQVENKKDFWVGIARDQAKVRAKFGIGVGVMLGVRVRARGSTLGLGLGLGWGLGLGLGL